MDKQVLSVNAAVEYLNGLGYPITRSTIYKHTMNRTIPFQKFGKRKIVFRLNELDSWIESRLVNADNTETTTIVAKAARRKGV